jgi:hypothetical protein
VDRVEIAGHVEEVVVGPVEGHVAGVGHDLPRRALGDQAARLFVEVAGVVEGQRRLRRLDRADRVGRRRLALGVEMAVERRARFLCLGRAFRKERAAEREGGARGGSGSGVGWPSVCLPSNGGEFRQQEDLSLQPQEFQGRMAALGRWTSVPSASTIATRSSARRVFRGSEARVPQPASVTDQVLRRSR